MSFTAPAHGGFFGAIAHALTRVRTVMRFGVIGAAATLVHVAVLSFGLSVAKLPLQAANALAFLIALSFSYVGNKYWAFASDAGHAIEGLRFLTVSLCGYAASALILEIAVHRIHLHYLIGMAIVLVIVPLQTYLLHALWTFRRG